MENRNERPPKPIQAAEPIPGRKPEKVMTRSQVRKLLPSLEEVPEVIVTKDGEFTVVDDPVEE